MITYRREIIVSCDTETHDYECHNTLVLDQLDAKTKKGMINKAKKEGWFISNNYCLCPYCATKETGGQ